jgi:hypothetical protein
MLDMPPTDRVAGVYWLSCRAASRAIFPQQLALLLTID